MTRETADCRLCRAIPVLHASILESQDKSRLSNNPRAGTSRRPSSISELAERTNIPWDEFKSKRFKDLLKAAEKYRREGKEYARLGDMENAFIELAKAATLVLETLPEHPDYIAKLKPNQRHNLGLNGQEILDNLAELKPGIVDRYEKWRQAHPDVVDMDTTPNVRTQQLANDNAATARAHQESRIRDEESDRALRNLKDTQLGKKEITSTFLPGIDFEPFSPTEAESSSIHRHSRHSKSPLSSSHLDALQSSNRGFTTLELPASKFPVETHKCGVCNKLFGVAQIIQLPTCKHTICKECLRTFMKTRINEGRYPIFCPVCAIEGTRVNDSDSEITQEIVDKLKLSKQDLEKLYALQLAVYSVILHCPKCKQTMNVDRGEYESQRIICPLPGCLHSWCKECLKPLASSQTEHNCKQNGFEQLMLGKDSINVLAARHRF